ncbi:hypothetical protein BZA77DRAFT_322624 [Pyronema omphalodes]|nr:hypothetical protein BZA77DRAFT_322624 [Pyronema omphalodes]
MQFPVTFTSLLALQLTIISSALSAAVPDPSSVNTAPTIPAPPVARPLPATPPSAEFPNGVPLVDLLPRAPVPEPATTCDNSGSGNSGCGNSGIGNTGTSNSGINNCGTNLSGIGEGCGDSNSSGNVQGTATVAADAAYTTTLIGPTSTVTVVADRNHRRTDCAYWRSQGYVCSDAGAVRAALGVVGAAAIGAVLVVV